MQLVFADDKFPTQVTKSIFLAGPSPRILKGDEITRTWRNDAVDYLKSIGYDGIVFVPLYREFFTPGICANDLENYDAQIVWEDTAMARADALLFWVPRTEQMRGMTTNIEIGRYLESGRLHYGRPDDAISMAYIDAQCHKRKIRVNTTLEAVCDEAVKFIGDGVYREDGAVLVPKCVYKTRQFRVWYQNHLECGNTLHRFNIKTILLFKNEANPEGFTFGFAADVSVHIKSEDRYKSNEWIFSRTATSYTVPYFIDENGDIQLVLVREFRSPANNERGYVYEFPGGSGAEGADPKGDAAKELEEETGLVIDDVTRIQTLGAHQTFATMLTNQVFGYCVELTAEEYGKLKETAKYETVLGENEEERITLHLTTLDSLGVDLPVDYTTLGLAFLLTKRISANREEANNPFLD